MDIVFPRGDEEDFIRVGERLGYDSLCLVYPLKDFKAGKEKMIGFKSKIKILFGVLTNEKDVRKAKKFGGIVFVSCGDNARHTIESNKNVAAIGLEVSKGKDFIHQRRSGLNHVMCKLAKKNNVKIGFSFRNLLNASEGKRNVFIGRISANIKLCRKYKVNMVIGSFASKPFEMRSYNDMVAFFSTLGMHPSEAVIIK